MLNRFGGARSQHAPEFCAESTRLSSCRPTFLLPAHTRITRAGRSDLYWTLDHARSPQAHTGQIALSPALRALDTHDLRRGLRRDGTNRTLACISRTRHARSRLPECRTNRTRHARSPADGCAHTGPIALLPAFRALDTHDLRRGLHFRLTLFVPPSAFKREFIKWGNVFH